MKQIFTILLLCLSITSFGQWVSGSEIESIAKSEMKSAERSRSSRVATLSDSVDIVYHDIFWRIVPGDTHIIGVVKTDFVVKSNQINSIYFDLVDVLVVDSVMYHSNNISFSRPGNNVLKIDLPTNLSGGTLDSVTVVYHGNPTTGNSFRHWGWVTSPSPISWTLSEPYGSSFWWPCKDGLNDKIDSIDISVSTTIGNRVASQGLLQQIDTIGTDVIYHWKHRHPITPYLVSIAIAQYIEFNVPIVSGQNTFNIQNYVLPNDSIQADWYVSRLPSTFALFDSLFIPYPFANEKYGHAYAPFGGGMEHQTMTTLGSWSDGLLDHELAHQWFGDYVTCGSWSDLWLNEGFATYLTGLAIEFGEGGQDWLQWRTGTIAHVTGQPGGSVYVADTNNVGRLFSSRLTYSKGAMLLHMLRWKCGEDDFFQGIRNYLNDPLVQDGFARTIDLQNHLEATSGLDLDEFMDDWFYGEGYPTYDILVEGVANHYAINIKQITSDTSVDFFEMPVEVQFFSDNGDTTIRFENTHNDQWINFHYSEKINAFQLDTNKWIVMGAPQLVLGNDDIEWSKKQPVVFPVPSADQVTITNISVDLDVANIRVYSVTGNYMPVVMNSTNGTIRLDVSELSPGVYLVSYPTWEKPLRIVKN